MVEKQFVVMPDEIEIWYFIENTIKNAMNLFNFKEIRTSILQSKELYEKHSRFSKEFTKKSLDYHLYNIEDEVNMSLRPEGTLSVLNTPIVNNALINPQKVFYYGPMFIKHQTDTKNINQFYQVGAEILGSKNIVSDIEVILLAQYILKSLYISHFHLEICSHGCENCHAVYIESMSHFLEYNYSNICDICQENTQINPLNIFRCEHIDCQNIANMSPKILDYLCVDCTKNFKEIKKLLVNLGIVYSVNPNLLLNFDYYTCLVFRFVQVESQHTQPDVNSLISTEYTQSEIDETDSFVTKQDNAEIAAKKVFNTAFINGGRYDNLASYITNQTLASVGFSFNIDAAFPLIKNNIADIITANIFTVCVGSLSENMELLILQVEQELHKKNIKTIIIEKTIEQNALNDIFNTYNCNILLLLKDDLILEGNIAAISYDPENNRIGQDIISLSNIMDYIKKLKIKNL